MTNVKLADNYHGLTTRHIYNTHCHMLQITGKTDKVLTNNQAYSVAPYTLSGVYPNYIPTIEFNSGINMKVYATSSYLIISMHQDFPANANFNAFVVWVI